jgi:signal transduction histidine kinase
MPHSLSPRSLGFRFLFYSIAPAIVLIGALGYLSFGSAQVGQNRVFLQHTVDVLFAANTIEAAIEGAERGQRGYLLTGDAVYLEPYAAAAKRIPAAVSTLQTLTADDQGQQQRILDLQKSLTTKLDELDRTIVLYQTKGPDAALELVRTNIGEGAMRAILADIDAIVGAERTLRAERQRQNQRESARLAMTAIAGAVVALIALASITLLLYRAYARLYTSQAALKNTLDSVREGVGAFDGGHRLVAWNQMFLKILGLRPDDVRYGLELAAIAALKEGGVIGEDLAQIDARARRQDKPLLIEREQPGGTVIELFHNPAADGGFVTTVIDATERRRSERIQRQAQKMESLGQMTGGIAHDFNNLLTIIVGNLGLLKNRLVNDPRALRHVEFALMGADRGAKLTNQLLAFARRQPLEPRPVNLATLLPDLAEMLRRALGELIEIETVGAAGLWNVSVDPNQFESAVLNLAINARDAMKDGGRLTLELANVWLDEAYAAEHGEVSAGQYVMFGVTDTGAGMAPEIAARAFDPFFSTKGEAGTGLGLSMVFGFVKQSGGHIKIYSEIGHGTTVKLYLPRSIDAAARPAYQPQSTADITGAETILVVEDEEAVRATVTEMLAALGYRVKEAGDGAAALKILEGGDPIDLLFTDVIMPGPVSSGALAARAREIRPEMPILFTSGYTKNTIPACS